MAWEIKDEWIDLAQARHVVVFHNPQVLVPSANGAGKHVPVEHHLIHEFKLKACPHCGRSNSVVSPLTLAGNSAAEVSAMAGNTNQPEPEPIDFTQVKADTLAALHAHHATLMAYRGKHPAVRIGNGPKA